VAKDATHQSVEHFVDTEATHQSVEHLMETEATHQSAGYEDDDATKQHAERFGSRPGKQHAELFTTAGNHSATLFVATVHTAESAAQVGTTDYINLSAAIVHTPRSTVDYVATDTNDQSADNWGARALTANLQAEEIQPAAVSQSESTASSDPACPASSYNYG
jgi:hypothetical protein